ncbi:hypothetical protein CEXT_429991 [Caerostris extrusa]|uniref:Uncharacterized protein n=1 Tax=Caerostris extrusa TaxID=172846 RepID=A0AAV4RYT1_CAEEX|nr:hypothetical protein CEXT_429991 [Caerostris extrusa]
MLSDTHGSDKKRAEQNFLADIWGENRIIITVADRDKLSGSAARDRLSVIKTRLSPQDASLRETFYLPEHVFLMFAILVPLTF